MEPTTPIVFKLTYLLVAAIGAIVPLAYRPGLNKFQAGVMVICGTVGAAILAHPVSMLAHPFLPGDVSDIDHAIAFICGVLIMRVAEEALLFVHKAVEKISEKLK